nr:hypothetical protein [Tanacetum cinerariifolium]
MVLEESIKTSYALPKGPLPPVVIREPERHRFHPRPNSLLHLPNKEPVLGYLKFSAKGMKRDVFRMPIPDKMADVNASSGQAPEMAPPVRTDDQILPRIRCHLDEQWFVLTKDTLREALQITPINNNQPFVAPLSSDALIIFFNELGYPKLVRNLSNVVTNDMFQPWRALLTIINLCLTGKTSRFKRLRAPVLQIVWGIVKQANIDYAERIWKEFVQSIHTFKEDKQNLSRHTTGKKKATLIVIPSIWFTKLIIHHLQRRHKFHPRPSSPLHLPNEEPILGYLKFSAKAKVAQHQRYLAGETWSVQDSPTPNPTKPARKPKSTAPKAPPRPAVSTPVTAEDAELQKVLEESMKTAYAAAPRGLLPPVVIGEPESGKYQPLPQVPGKGKAKVTEEQVTHDLLSLQKPNKKSPEDQYIFQRRISESAGSSLHDESRYVVLGQLDSEEESEQVVLGATEGGNDEDQAGPDPGAQAKGQTGSDTGAQDEGQAGSNLDETSEGQAGPDPGNARDEVQSIPSHVVHAGSDHEHMDLDVADVSPQPSTEQLDEGFTATAYPKVHQQFKATTIDTTTTTTTTLPPPQAQQQSTAEAMMMKRIGELVHIIANLIQVNKEMEERLDKHGARLYTLEQLDIPQQLLEALEKSMNRDHSEELAQDLAEARKKKKKSRESPKTPPGSLPHHPPPPPPPPPAGPSGASGAPRAFGSSQVPPPPSPPPSSTNQENIGSVHIPKVNLRKDWWKPLEEERPATPEPAWPIPSFDAPVPPNNWASALASNYLPPPEDSLLAQTGDMATFIDCVDDTILRNNVSKPLPLGGPPSQVTIQTDIFFNKDLEYLRYGSKGSRPALPISKMKAAYYPDDGLEQMVPDQF